MRNNGKKTNRTYKQRLTKVLFSSLFLPILITFIVMAVFTYKEISDNIYTEYNVASEKAESNFSASLLENIDKIVGIKVNSSFDSYMSGAYANDPSGAFTFLDKYNLVIKAYSTDLVGDIRVYCLNGIPFNSEYFWRYSTFEEDPLNYSNDAYFRAFLTNPQKTDQNFIYYAKKTAGEEYLIILNQVFSYDGETLNGFIRVAIDMQYVTENLDVPVNSDYSVYLELDGKYSLKIDYSMLEGERFVKTNLIETSDNPYHQQFNSNKLIGVNYQFDTMHRYMPLIYASIVCLILLLVAFVIIRLYTARISTSLMSRINDLLRYACMDMEDLINTKLNQSDEVYSDEFGEIDSKIVELISYVRQYYDEANASKSAVVDMQMELLQKRFNPHLLYNTLACIKYKNKDKETSKIIDSLVKYYRISLRRDGNIVRLRDELDLLYGYVDIINFSHDIDVKLIDECNDYELPILKNILQPFVENSIFHGLEEKKSDYKFVKISVTSDESNITISVYDNGLGMDEDTLQRFRQGSFTSTINNFGSSNTFERIRKYYQDKATISVDSKEGEYTLITISIAL
ncbi:MAG: histidine kinase [Clostridia bacterium]|nr:histidine kinase [Clostridia bacterium]